ncbi:TonB family protein [Hymenobacter properus]|uniref:TonB family protein n=1 Tax=Hymenobacter properus TaxID=2791026 RepID=A0A931BF89_9BACT|nr:TonB family protein [Hymenobacter properus]MBF9140227.1 TonB family protein [Hymenobacter properus]MBR7719034.1 TonB family protein [Microvirga sp. SRT04]
MDAHRLFLLLIWLAMPGALLAQKANPKRMVYYEAKNHPLPSPTGAVYAIQTEYIDSLRAIERWFSGPQKIREMASFSNIRRRYRDGETITYYDDGSVKTRLVYNDGHLVSRVSYYPNHKLRRQLRVERDSVVEDRCFSESGALMNCDTLARQLECPNGKPKPCTFYSVVRYPAKALKAGAQGKVTVSFVVSRFGELVDAWVVDSPSPLLNEEAVAAIRRMK